MTIGKNNPDLKTVDYFRKHHLPDLFECLIVGLITTCPDDPLRWLSFGFEKIEDEGLSNITWDMFIPKSMTSNLREVADSYLDEILVFGTSTQPTPEMLSKAYDFYRTKIKKKCFDNLLKYCRSSIKKKKTLEEKLKYAKKYYEKRLIRIHFRTWRDYGEHLKEMMKRAYGVIERVYMESICKEMLQQWFNIAQEERRTREYFERLERGEIEADIDLDVTSSDFSDKISMLPNKCVMLIFSYLNIMDLGRCAKVCRSWRVLTGSSSLWSNINFSRIKSRLTDLLVLQFLQKFRAYLVHINLRQCGQVLSHTLTCISECRNLQDLNLSECIEVDDQVMKVIATNCVALLYLNISHCPITDATLRSLARHSENLQYLSIAHCVKCTDKGLQYFSFARGCGKLIHLDLTGCVRFTSAAFENVAQCCVNLQSINVNELGSLNDQAMMHLSKCINLRSISMLGPSMVNDAGFKSVVVNKKLRKLCIESNGRVTDYTFKCISRCCLLLAHLYVVDCPQLTDASLRHLSQLRNLVVVNLADCFNISDIGMRHLISGHSAANFREINLTNCYKMSDVTMMRLSQKCQSLTHLVISFCDHVTDPGLEMIARLPLLYHIDLSGTNVTDESLEALGGLISLRSIVLSECSGISDIGMEKFSFLKKKLEVIDISHCMDLTDQAIKNLAFCCRGLTTVNMAGCPKMSDLSIQYLASVCKYLHVVNVSGCLAITNKGINFLMKKCSQLHSLSLLYCRNVTKRTARKASATIENVEFNGDSVPDWYNYSDITLLPTTSSEELHKTNVSDSN